MTRISQRGLFAALAALIAFSAAAPPAAGQKGAASNAKQPAPASTASSSTAAAPSDATAAPSGASALVQQIHLNPARLQMAEALSTLAATPQERQFAQKAVRLADHETDVGFLTAVRLATEHPVLPTPALRALDSRIKSLEDSIAAQQARVDDLKKKFAKARGSRKESVRGQLDLAQAELDLSQDELAEAHEDLINAGGDLKSQVQQMQADHEATTHQSPATGSAQQRVAPPSSSTALDQLRIWISILGERKQLAQAKQEAADATQVLQETSDALKNEMKVRSGAAPGNQAPAAAAQSPATPGEAAALLLMRQLAGDRKTLADYDRRIRDLGQLAGVYGNWDAEVAHRQREAGRGLLISVMWIILIVLTGIIVQRLLHRLFQKMTQDRRRLHTLQTMSRFGVQAFCLALILLVVLGPPGQLATLVAFAGAGLTVALKDFIVSFIGWFMLMGKNGVHVGDWVEIRGVCGEVIEVSLFHTVLLETGNWTDAGHPTGRKVNFTNSYAIEGHYFNFTTSGQWLWDELEFMLPEAQDPNAAAAAVLQIVAEETRAKAQLAEQEWIATAGAAAGAAPTVSAAPVLTVRPTADGISGRVRYITRANERFEARSRLYHLIVECLHSRAAQPAAAAGENQHASKS